MRVVVASGGRFHSIHLAQQLLRQELLHRLYSWSCNTDETLLFHERLKKNWLYQSTAWMYEKFRIQKILSPAQWYVLHDNWFDQWLAHSLEEESSFDVFVGWAHYVLGSIPIARQKGALVALEMGSMHILENQKILQKEYERHGFYAPAIDQRNVDKMLAEYEAVDAIMVPSSHVRESFIKYGFDQNKIVMVPYGTNRKQFTCRTVRPEKYRVLFVGRVGLAKGIHYLLEAWDQLHFSKKDAELHIVGPLDEQIKEYLNKRPKDESIFWHGGLAHNKLVQLYQQASLFVLPSLQEGLAMVLIEAMASGLPLLATNRTGAQDIIENGQEGFVVSPEDSRALAEKIAWGFEHQDQLFEMGQKAALKAEKYTWDAYGKAVVAAYERLLNQSVHMHESTVEIWKNR